MRKLSLTLVLLVILILPAQARTATELGRLAAYYPADTVFYAAARTDAGLSETLDGLVARLGSFVPGALPPGINFSFLLNSVAAELGADNFDSLRSWLGDTVAVGLYINESVINEINPPLYITLPLTDSAAALAFITDALTNSGAIEDYAVRTDGDFTLFESEFLGDTEIAIGPDVMFLAENLDLVPVFGVQASLADQSNYQSTLSQLPAESYNVVLYVDAGMLQTQISSLLQDEDALALPPELLNLSNTQAIGLTVLNGDSLVWDNAVLLPAAADVEALGIAYPELGPLNADFTARIPADAVLVSQGSDFGAGVQSALDSLRGVGDYIDANGGIVSFLGLPEGQLSADETAALNLINPRQIIPLINISFAGLTGLNLELDVLPVLSGDSASFVRLLPNTSLPGLPVLPDLGVIFQTSDEAGAAGLVEQLQLASEAYNTGYSIAAYGDGAALVMPIISNALGQAVPATDLLFGASGDMFALGTRPAVESALNTEGGLSSTAAFMAAQAILLQDAQQLLYIDLAPLNALLGELDAQGQLPLPPRDLRDLRLLLSLLESASISTVQTDTAAISRLVLTLADAPIELPDPASGS